MDKRFEEIESMIYDDGYSDGELFEKIISYGATKVVERDFGEEYQFFSVETTLFDCAIMDGRYELALRLAKAPEVDRSVLVNGVSMLSEMQNIDSQSKEEMELESKWKLEIARALLETDVSPDSYKEEELSDFFRELSGKSEEAFAFEKEHKKKLRVIVAEFSK